MFVLLFHGKNAAAAEPRLSNASHINTVDILCPTHIDSPRLLSWYISVSLCTILFTKRIQLFSGVFMLWCQHTNLTYKISFFFYLALHLITWCDYHMWFVYSRIRFQRLYIRYFALWEWSVQYIDAPTKCLRFRRRSFQMHFLEWKCLNFD